MMIRQAIIIVLLAAAPAQAAEPLHGPEVGITWWRQSLKVAQADQKSEKTTTSSLRQRRFFLDIPIPLALWTAMPFATVRYIDHTASTGFFSDQQYGVGLLHHAAEGDPAWRIETSRIGLLTHVPASRTRGIFNLAKAFPALRLRPSDTTYSWVGLNALTMPGKKTLWIPELAWTTTGADGLMIDLVLPEHVFLGYRRARIGFAAGAEQFIRRWQGAHAVKPSDWIIDRRAKSTVTYVINTASAGDVVIAASILKTLGPNQTPSAQFNTDNESTMGTELALNWIPNP